MTINRPNKQVAAHPQAREAAGEEWEGREPEPALDADIIPQATLRKYIAYAKQNCRPKLQNADYDKIAQVPLWPRPPLS